MTIEDSMKRLLDENRQLQNHKGPYYDHWLRCYRQAVESGKCGGDSRYVQGMKAFLSEAEKKGRKRRGDSTR